MLFAFSSQTADVGLTESVGESGLKFELWFRRRKAGETYILQVRLKYSLALMCTTWHLVIKVTDPAESY